MERQIRRRWEWRIRRVDQLCGTRAGGDPQADATSSTDTGHKGGGTDALWALGHPEKIIDYGYRAIHETSEKSKAVVRAFYGEGPQHSYFSSCSNGGRQALMEAQRYAADYDGLIAGAPSANFTRIAAGFTWDEQSLEADPGQLYPGQQVLLPLEGQPWLGMRRAGRSE